MTRITTKLPGLCQACQRLIAAGTVVLWDRETRTMRHLTYPGAGEGQEAAYG